MTYKAFEAWFKAQFGGLPSSPNEVETLRIRQKELKYLLSQVEDKIYTHEILSASWRACLYTKGLADKKYKY